MQPLCKESKPPSEHPIAACPHPDCTGVMPVPLGTPEGDYPCTCHGCKVNLCWFRSWSPTKRPILFLAGGKAEAAS
jgi:hypothetical protein